MPPLPKGVRAGESLNLTLFGVPSFHSTGVRMSVPSDGPPSRAEEDGGEAKESYLGADPGSKGALALITPGGVLETVAVSSLTLQDLWRWLRDRADALHRPPNSTLSACLEKVGGFMPGSAGNIGSAMFTFGSQYGGLRMALVAAGIPFEEVQASKWQKALGVPPRRKGKGKAKGEAPAEFKRRLKAHAQQLFPDEDITLANADAVLLAEYCRRKKAGVL